MKYFLIFIMLCLNLCAQAQENETAAPAAIASLVDYPSLSLSGTRWWGHGEISRTLFVRLLPVASGRPLVFTRELESQNQALFPAEAIQSEVTEIDSGHAEYAVKLRFDLRQAPASGQYQGKIRLRHGETEYVVPVSLTIKDPWQPALLIVLFGVALGIWANTYQSQGRPRDELLLKISRLRRGMQGDPAAGKAAPFARRVEELLLDVDVALENSGIEASQEKLKEAQAVWNRWRRGREDWLKQLDYQAELAHSLANLPDTGYVREMAAGLDELARQAADFAEPARLREHLRVLGEQLNAYLPLARSRFLQTLPESHDLRYQFDELSPFLPVPSMAPTELNAGLAQSLSQLKSLQDAVKQAEQQATPSRALPFEALPKGLDEETLAAVLSPPPSVQALGDWQKEASAAKVRLEWFAWFSYGTAVVFLAGAGFEQLYTANPVFGAQPVNDYLGLLAWGFAAEASRASVTRLIQEWRPGGK